MAYGRFIVNVVIGLRLQLMDQKITQDASTPLTENKKHPKKHAVTLPSLKLDSKIFHLQP